MLSRPDKEYLYKKPFFTNQVYRPRLPSTAYNTTAKEDIT